MSRRRRLGVAGLALAVLWTAAALAPPAARPEHPFFARAGGGAGGRVLAIAHRGGGGLGPEATLDLFRRVAALGVDVLEMDVRPTADGALVVFHDRRVDRATDGRGPVDSLSLAQLRDLDAGFQWSADGGATHPWRGRGLRIPTLDEVLEAFPERRLLLELKAPDTGAARQVCGALRARGCEGDAIVASFHGGALDAFRQACPSTATSASWGEACAFWLLQRLRLDALYRPPFAALQVPERFGPFAVVDRGFVERARRHGIPVQVWTIDREEEMARFIDLGVNGIVTDRPDLLLALLRARGLR